MQDNTLARALRLAGADAVLLPTYTPVRVDEENVSGRRVFLGGINVWLDSRIPGWSKLPRVFKRWLDGPGVVKLLARFGSSTRAADLGPLTVDLLAGSHGPCAASIEELVEYVAGELRPDVVVFSNALLSGVVPALRRRWSGPMVCLIQGDDIFLEDLPEPWRQRSLELIRGNCVHFAGYLAHSEYYADFMAGYLGLRRDRFRVIPLAVEDLPAGLQQALRRSDERVRVGYFARICPEKGAFRFLEAVAAVLPKRPDLEFVIGGFLPALHAERFQRELERLKPLAGDRLQWLGSPSDRLGKFEIFSGLDWLCVPSEYREPKGIYVLEAALVGVPALLPDHGAFPERVSSLGAGRLFRADSTAALADSLLQLGNTQESALRSRLRQQCLAVHGLGTAGAACLGALRAVLSGGDLSGG
jgi:glycosyltransferase involved in cell wall biosynthesis